MSFQEVTDKNAIVAAANEFRQIGRDSFLKKYGFGRAQIYFLRYEDELLDSKSVVKQWLNLTQNQASVDLSNE